ncbi:MAG TPA: matrixin family metalloprotease [Gammaproteobacteria bacterium]|nr:matrixin family metalloprotease [Gammaproteobacteria bacterium]
MRRHRPIILVAGGLLVVSLALWFWQDRLSWPGRDPALPFVHAPCNIPVHYTLGEVDARFGFDEFTVMTALVEAAGLWQSATDVLLLIESDHPLAMRVDLAFDARQDAANTRRSLRGGLERDRLQLEDEEVAMQQWTERIEAARRAHDQAGEELARRVRRHEADVTAWNSGSGQRTDARRRALEAESTALRMALADLERMAEDLNADIASYNRRAGDLRQRTQDFRSRVGRYNEASSAAPVESGRYQYDREQGRRIEVYRAESYDELVWVFAHELGHALGLGHVPEPGAIMNAMLHEGGASQPATRRPVNLSAADRAALAAVCAQQIL